MLCSALNSSGPHLQRQLAYKSWLGTSGPDCYLKPKIRHLQKTSCIQIRDMTLTTNRNFHLLVKDEHAQECKYLRNLFLHVFLQIDTIIWTLELLSAFSLHFLHNIFKCSFIHAFSTAMLLQAVSSIAFTSTSIRFQACPFLSAPEINVKCTLSFTFSTLSLCGQSLIRCLVLLHSKHIIMYPSAFFGLPSTLLNSCCYYL